MWLSALRGRGLDPETQQLNACFVQDRPGLAPRGRTGCPAAKSHETRRLPIIQVELDGSTLELMMGLLSQHDGVTELVSGENMPLKRNYLT